MSQEMENARTLVRLEEQTKRALAELKQVSTELRRMGKDIVITSWDWNRPGATASIVAQGEFGFAFYNEADRPKRQS